MYESAEIRMVRTHLRSASHLVDLGASLGVVSSAAARLLPPGAEVTCVEANAQIAALTSANLARNAPHVRAGVINGAIDYTRSPGQAVSFVEADEHVGSAIDADGTRAGFTAPAVRLTDLVQGVKAFSLVMDIEGAEVGLLLAEAQTLQRCQQLVAELHATEHDGRRWEVPDILQLATSLGFTVTASYGNVFVLTRTPAPIGGPHA
ncbi:FkbM family methyltransferase [Nocardioides marinquilinus]